MKIGRDSRRSIRYSVFVGVLAGSVFSGSGAFAALEISTQSDLERISTDTESLAQDYILLNNIALNEPSIEGASYVVGTFTGTFNGNGKTLSGLNKPLFQNISGESDTNQAIINNLTLVTTLVGIVGNGILADSADSNSVIENVAVKGKVNGGTNENVGGLIGSSSAVLSNVFSTAEVEGKKWVGGLVGKAISGSITNSYATGNVTSSTETSGSSYIGGLVGEQIGGLIKNSLATGNVTVVDGTSFGIGGLVGTISAYSSLENSYATGNVEGGGRYIGGLVGENKSSTITNSFASGTVQGSTGVGGLVGISAGQERFGDASEYARINASGASGNVFINSYLTNEYIGSLVGFLDYTTIENSYGTGSTQNINHEAAGGLFGKIVVEDNRHVTLTNNLTTGTLPDALSVLGSSFSTNSCINNNKIYLVDLIHFYSNSCTREDTAESFKTFPRQRIETYTREIKETLNLEKIEKSVGFKNETPLPKTATISFIETTEKLDLVKLKALEIAPTANVKVSAKTGEALQISLKSESKEPVELWVKSPVGSWLLAGVITFGKDGKAILPPLQFKNAGEYTLVFNKPSADSAKGSAPLNQSGSLLVAAS